MTDLANELATNFDANKVPMFEQYVNAMYGSNNQDVSSQQPQLKLSFCAFGELIQRQVAHQVLNVFKENPDAWLFTDTIIENTQNTNAKFFALQILDEAVQKRWNILPQQQRDGIKQYIVNQVIQIGSLDNISNEHKHYLTKLNTTLVNIVKHEWTTTWKNFIPEICGGSKSSQPLCENNLNMLRMLSEEIFDFSKQNMTSVQAQNLKGTMTQEFVSVFDLCNYVLDTYISTPQQVKNTLVKACLKTFSAFMSWIPLAYIFQTDICDKMLNFFLTQPSFRIETIKSFAEIFALKINKDEEPEADIYTEKLYIMYAKFMLKISEVTNNVNFLEEYHKISAGQRSHFENFCNQMALLVSSFVKNNLHPVENILANNQVDGNDMLQGLLQSMEKSLVFMVQFSFMPEEGMFKICVEFWHFLTYEVMISTKGSEYFGAQQQQSFPQIQQPSSHLLLNSALRVQIYPRIMDEIRKVTIEKMAKPREVLIVIDENGEAVEEQYDDTETISLYETMRELLIHLTNIDTYSTDKIMQSKLDILIRDERSFSFDALNKLCWALGSIQGCMSEEDENRFVVAVIKELLNLCEQKKGKDNKAIVAANIMYVVGQFPRFLEAHWAFLKTVIKKLNEFMHEKHPGVQDMASDTFLKIAKQTKAMFIIIQDKENEAYVCELIRRLPDNTRDLEAHQKLQVYEGIGHMISVEENPLNKEQYIFSLMQYADSDFKEIINQANNNIDYLKFPDVIRLIGHLIKINERVCFSVGHFYYQYLSRVFVDLLQIYKLYSQHISNAVARDQNISAKSAEIKSMKSVRREVLKLIQTFIKKSSDVSLISNELLPQFSSLIADYNETLPDARDPEVILLFSCILQRYGVEMTQAFPQIVTGFMGDITSLCSIVIQMISNDFQSYMEFRQAYFTLLRTVIKDCLFGFFSIQDPQVFQNLIDSLIWAFKHEKYEIMELGLEAIDFLIEGVIDDRDIASKFFASYYLKLLEEVMVVMCDQLHLTGFDLQAAIVQKLFIVVEQSMVSQILFTKQFDSVVSEGQTASNKEFLLGHLTSALCGLFQNLNKVQVEAFILQMFNNCQDKQLFKNTMRDLLISTKEFANREDEFYQAEKEVRWKEFMCRQSEMKQMQQNEQAKRSAIPGLAQVSPGFK